MSLLDQGPGRRGQTRRRVAALFVGLGLLGLGGCGFQPLYGETGAGYSAQSALAQIEIAPIRDRAGQQLRNELIREFTPNGGSLDPAYRMQITLSVAERDVFTRETSDVERKTVRMTATYTLVDIVSDQPVHEGIAFTETSFNRVVSEFANIRARTDAENRAAVDLAQQISQQVAAAFVSGRV